MKKRYYDFLVLAIAGILYVFSVIRATLLTMHVPVQTWHMLLFAMASFLFYCLINTKVGRVIFLSAVGAGLCFGVFLIFRNGISNLSTTFQPVLELVNVMVKVGTGYYDDSIPFSLLMNAVGVYSLIIALPVYYLLVKYFRFYLLFAPGLISFMIVWGINRYVDKLSFYIFITIAIVCYIRHIYLISTKNNRNSDEALTNGSMFAYFVPIAAIVLLLSATIPVSQKPIEWPWLDKKIYNLWWDMHEKFSVDRYDSFSLAKTGFGNPSRLGGPVYADNTPILLVEAPTRVYLRGAVYDNYTGTGWEMTEISMDDSFEDRVYDHRELTYGWKANCVQLGVFSIDEYGEYLLNGSVQSKVQNIPQEEFIEFLKFQTSPRVLVKLFPEEKISVQHLNVRTKSLFTPLKMFVPFTGLSSEIYKLNEGVAGIFQSDRRLRGGSTYNIKYLQPAYGMKELENLFNLSRPGLYADFNNQLEKFIKESGNSDAQSRLSQELTGVLHTYDQLEKRRDNIYKLYTSIPEVTPERVKELAKAITSSSNTTYTKVKSLENYLRENYHYTLTPVYPPSEQDFVDYFLFDGKEGYCTYFASALCVMTRAIGIPSRYVEGFLLPKESDRYNRYQVTNKNAHAWVEVYLEGAGWVTFEPTPPMAGALNYYVRLHETNAGESGHIPEYFEEHEQQVPKQNVFIPDMERDLSDNSIAKIRNVLISIIAFILVVLILNLLYVSARWMVFRLVSQKKSIRLLYRYAVSLLSQSGDVLQTGQTPKDYAKLIDERYNFTCMSMSEMVDLYYSVRFGSKKLDKKTMKSILSFVSEVKTKTGRNMYFTKRLLYRLVLFKG